METNVRLSRRPGTPRAKRHTEDKDTGIRRLLITCPDRPGIVAAVSNFLAARGANITESQQYSTDPFGGTFFLRLEFHTGERTDRSGDLAARFAELAAGTSMRWTMTKASDLKRVAIMVSKADHALQEILSRTHWGELKADIRMVISNHPDAEEVAAWWGIPFHHVPVTRENAAAEDAQLELLAGGIDLVILARYMRILSPRFLSNSPGQLSTFITASSPPLSAPTRTSKPPTMASSSSVRPPITSPRNWTPGRSSNRTSSGLTTGAPRLTCAGSGATSSGRYWPARSAGIWKTG